MRLCVWLSCQGAERCELVCLRRLYFGTQAAMVDIFSRYGACCFAWEARTVPSTSACLWDCQKGMHWSLGILAGAWWLLGYII